MGRDVCFGARTKLNSKPQVKTLQMSQWERARQERPAHKTFRGSVLVTLLLEKHPKRFRSRVSASIFARKLFREGKILSVCGASGFEDSDQQFYWSESDSKRQWKSVKSSPPVHTFDVKNNRNVGKTVESDDETILESVKGELNSNCKILPEKPSVLKTIIKQLEEDSGLKETQTIPKVSNFSSYDEDQSLTSSDPYVVAQRYSKFKERTRFGGGSAFLMATRDHDVIPEEEPSLDKTGNSLELELTPRNSEHSSVIEQPVHSEQLGVSEQSRHSESSRVGDTPTRRWLDGQNSYSDNEKQLIEEMKRMKEDHSITLAAYEERIKDLMGRMHDLRGIAEMLENSSNKSSPYGILPARSSFFNFIGARLEQERRQATAALGGEPELPPPLPPRPGRTNKVYPNKPIIHPKVKMKPLDWSRIIVKDAGEGTSSTIWHTMVEPKLEAEEAERLFQNAESAEVKSLYDDIARVRGKTKQQLVTLLDVEKSRRAVYTMKSLPCSMNDVISVVTSLETKQINSDRFAELLELIGGGNEIEKVQFHVRRKTSASLDYPEYMLYEMSKVSHCKERMDFLRFRYRVQWHLFETEQQLKELHTACEEVSNSTALKNLLQSLLAVGNYLNGGTENGQADGFGLEVMNRLKEVQDRDAKGNLLEFVLKLYCQCYEVEIELGCPTKFRLPEPSNMRHAAQVSFENINEALSNIKAEVRSTREKFLVMSTKDGMDPRDNLWTTTENFMTCALEIILEEERLLQDTRSYFRRTTAYFLLDPDTITPQEFFQLWATFLHDCKYYWKLAHRKLGKERFEIDFKHRAQLVAMFGHKFMDTVQNPPAARRTANIQKERPNATDVSVPSQVVQMNGYPDSTDKGVAPKDVSTTYKSHLNALQESHSPKQLTCEPPSSGLHKPLPKAASTTSVPSENGMPSANNYENHEDIERAVAESRSGTSQSDTLEWAGKKNDKQQFNFVSWLKREPNKHNNTPENKTNADTPHQAPERHPVTTQNSTSFSKFKNSVVQKFTHSPSSKRTAEVAGLQENRDIPHGSPMTSLPSYMPLRVVVSENEISPYVTSMGRDSRPAATRYHESQKYATQPGGSSSRDYRTNSADRRNVHDTRIMTTGGCKGRTGSNVSTEYAGLYHTPPFHAPVDKDGYSSPNVVANNFEKSDINNNTTPKNANREPVANGVVRTRAPLLLGSNVSISDAYQSNDRDGLPTRHPIFEQGASRRIDKSTHLFQHAPTSVPSYSAKRVHNYENQGRLETGLAVKQRADPVAFPPTTVTPSSQGPMTSHMNTFPLTSRSSGLPTNSQSFPSSTQSTPAKNPTVHHRVHETPIVQENTPVSSSRQPPAKPSRNLQLNFGQDNRRDEKKLAASLDRLDRNGHSVPSISTLINRFEKKQNLLEAVNNEEKLLASDVAKTLTMTSTPVIYKGPPELDPDENEPPPVPPRSDHSFQDNYPSDSLDSRSSRGHGRKVVNVPDSQTKTNYDLNIAQKYSFGDTNPATPLSTKSNHVRQETGLSDQDDGYRERLRKAAASSTVFERHNKHLTPQYHKQNYPVQFSTPQYNRQNSQPTSVNSSQAYSRQSSTTQSQASSQPERMAPQNARSNGSQLQPSRTNGNVLTVTNKLGLNNSQYQNNHEPSTPSQPQQFSKDNTLQQRGDLEGRVPTSAMAVVSPTLHHHGNVTFMEI
ncbi:formin-J-like isoform X2 [Argopecten irradians]|uniref:formin-J-like isoform X2 n=1 Tax=Argopecten irradians TaxID=31199 RepID=UPI00372356C1